MSAWSSAAGKAQLSYADRLRQANKSNAPTRQDPSSSRSQESTKSGSHSATGSQGNRRLSSASSASAATSSGSAHRRPSNAADAKDGAASGEPSTTPQKSAGPPVNIWEARRKQIAEREAEKEKERQAILAQQRKAVPASTTGNNANAGGKQEKQNNAGGASSPKRGNERHSKGASNPSQSERKTNKQANQASNRSSSPAPISSQRSTAAASSDKPSGSNAGLRNSNAGSTPKSGKADNNRAADEARSTGKAAQQPSVEQSTQSTAPNKAESTDKPQKPKAEEKGKSADPAKTTFKQVEQSVAAASGPAQSAAAKVPPSTALSVSTAPAPIALHEDIPASPATVASAIEEVLKNGGANGGQTEDDDAWLARIHLLNGGQNMPKFGGFANGVTGLSDEAETQAAKKAERAVAAAWGAGKSVWNKSLQQNQQRSVASKEAPASMTELSAPKESALAATRSDAVPIVKDVSSASTTAPVSVNGGATESNEGNTSQAPMSQEAGPVEKSSTPDSDATQSKMAQEEKSSATAETQQARKPSAFQPKASSATSVPSFEDPNNWPSPLDAGKKPTVEKPKPAITSTEADTTKPKVAKSFIETLDELQLRLAPTTAVGGKKGKKEWVSILPEITHTSTSGAGVGKQSRPSVDGKAQQGKGQNKQQQQQHQQPRKDGNSKGAGQTQIAQGSKKEGTSKANKAQAKDVAGDSSNPKAAESRAKGDKDAPAPKSIPRASLTSSESKPQSQESVLGQTAAESSASTTSKAAAADSSGSESTSAPTPRADSNAKQQRPGRTHLRPTPNGISAPPFQPNGIHRPKSSGASTPNTNRSSPRGSVTSSPQVHHSLPPRSIQSSNDSAFLAAQPSPLYFTGGPSGAATPMQPTIPTSAQGWLPYNPYNNPPLAPRGGVGGAPQPQISPYVFDATQPLPQGVLGQLLGQIEFYFSQHNLQGDFFLRSKMDSQGWVDIGVVAGFKRVLGITGGDGGLVLDSLLYSAVLDVDEVNMRVRKRFGWEVYTLQPPSAPMEEVSAVNGAFEAAGGEEEKELRNQGSGGDAGKGEGERDDEAETGDRTGGGGEDDEPALGVVAASGFNGALEA